MPIKVKRISNIIYLHRNKLILILKISVSLSALFFLFWKIKNQTTVEDLINVFSEFNIYKTIFCVLTVLLAVPNLLLEGLKWKTLLQNIEKVNILNAMRAVLAGMSISMLTPNRLGEIPGRSVFTSPGNRKKALLAASVGSLNQAFVTIFMGTISIFLLNNFYNFGSKGFSNFKFSIIITALIVVLLLTFSLEPIRKKVNEHKQKIGKLIEGNVIYRTFILSILRYIIFTCQYFILLKIFHVDILWTQGFLAIAATYLVLYITPFLTITEPGVRGSASILCIGFFSDNIMGILLAGLSIWLINIALPALTGSILLLRHKRSLQPVG